MTHDNWLALFYLCIAALGVLYLIPSTPEDEDGKPIDLDNERELERRRKNMDCYGRHEWIVKTDGKRCCKICKYEHPEEE